MTRKGRKRKAAKRTPSGQISREGQESPMQVALDARVRVLKVAPSIAMDQDCISVLGRLYLTRDRHGRRLISQGEKLAGEAFERIHAACAAAIQTPIPLAKRDPSQPMDWDAMDQKAREEYTDRAVRAEANWVNISRWLRSQGILVSADVLRVCIDDHEPFSLKRLKRGLGLIRDRLKISENQNDDLPKGRQLEAS